MGQSFVLTGSALQGTTPHLFTAAQLAALPAAVYTGRNRPRARAYTLDLENYFDKQKFQNFAGQLGPIDWYTKAAAAIAHMYLNDQLGCCVISSAFHQVGLWTGNETGTPVVGTDKEVLASYRIWNPGNQDNGCVITDVLDYTRDHGLPFNGVIHKIDNYVSINWTNWDLVQAALYLFGSVKLGINLPSAWLNNAIWDVTNTAIVGGHDVPGVGTLLSPNKVRIASWARTYDITQAAFTSKKWLEEAYVPLSPDWYAKANQNPVGISADDLRSDLAKLDNGTIPPLDPNMQPWESILP